MTNNVNLIPIIPFKNEDDTLKEKHTPTWERRLEEAKKRHRPKLKHWDKDGFYTTRRNDFSMLKSDSNVRNNIRDLKSCPSSSRKNSDNSSSSRNSDRNYDRSPDVSSHANIHSIDRISCKEMTPSEFISYYEKECLPVIIGDIPKEEHWPAVNSWNFNRTRDSSSAPLKTADSEEQRHNSTNDYSSNSKSNGTDNDSYSSLHSLYESYFKVGEDDDGYKVKVRLRYFLKYLENNTDDSPLYIFDSNFDNNDVTKRILTDYHVPSFFPDDLFSLVGEKRRPPYRVSDLLTA